MILILSLKHNLLRSILASHRGAQLNFLNSVRNMKSIAAERKPFTNPVIAVWSRRVF